AAGGYPDAYGRGDTIEGLPAHADPLTHVFHAGTVLAADGTVRTSGGRVLCVTALGDTVAAAQQRAYASCRQIHWDGCFYRNDIGHRAIARERSH
ncbi:MAG TPA: phosphoribosylglycinamide synthetase C domain-containing protein, partial [Pseudomonadales bacterium]|nr:phosphoribosylglycinamide synthetase C domain-containing protein [Pseudomonadales bacterium]